MTGDRLPPVVLEVTKPHDASRVVEVIYAGVAAHPIAYHFKFYNDRIDLAVDAEFRLIRIGVRGPLEADEPLMLPMVPMCNRATKIKGLPISILYVDDRVVGVHVHERCSGERRP